MTLPPKKEKENKDASKALHEFVKTHFSGKGLDDIMKGNSSIFHNIEDLFKKTPEYLQKIHEFFPKIHKFFKKNHELFQKNHELLTKNHEIFGENHEILRRNHELLQKNHELLEKNNDLFGHYSIQKALSEIKKYVKREGDSEFNMHRFSKMVKKMHVKGLDAETHKHLSHNPFSVLCEVIMMSVTHDPWLPVREADLFAFQNIYMSVMISTVIPAVFAGNQEFTDDFTQKLLPAQLNYVTAYIIAGVDKKATRNRIQLADLKAKKELYIDALRELNAAYIRFNPRVTNAMREALGVPIYDNVRTHIEPPIIIPAIEIFPKNGHILNITAHQPVGEDGSSQKGMPEGVSHLKIYYQIGGTAPASYDLCNKTKMTTKVRNFRLQFSAADVGKPVYLFFCWVNTKDEEGPISDMIIKNVP